MFEKDIAPQSTYPRITIEKPKQGSVVTGPVRFEGTVEGDFTAAQVMLDNGTILPLKLKDGRFAGEVELPGGLTGAHWYRIGLRGPDGTAWKSGDFVIDSHADVQVAWRTLLGGSSKSTPTAWGELVLVGANDGRLHALNADTGQVAWTVETGGDVLGQALVLDGRGYVGSGDGRLYEFTQDGEVTREFDAGSAILSSPATAGEAIVVATAAGDVIAVDRGSFEELWRSDAPEYAIEDTLFVAGDVVCFGAWDMYVYALSPTTGELLWRSAASGTLEGGAKRYYSPADCGPVVSGGRVFAADRKYHMSVMDLATGELVDSREGVSGTGISEDGKSVYIRTTRSGMVKLDADWNEQWTADVPTGSVAAAPIEKDGTLYSVSTLGTLSAIDADSGTVKWSIRVLPGFFAMADPCASNGTVYVAGMDGSVTAVRER